LSYKIQIEILKRNTDEHRDVPVTPNKIKEYQCVLCGHTWTNDLSPKTCPKCNRVLNSDSIKLIKITDQTNVGFKPSQ